MGLDRVKAEIAHMRLQIKRQQSDIRDLRKSGIDPASALALLARMHLKVDELIGERSRLTAEASAQRRTYASGKVILGTPSTRRI